jgi:DNA-binding NarL/FixJ family response regulator
MKHARVLVADGHDLARARICELVAVRYEVVGAVRDGHELLEAARRLDPDVLVVDIALPELHGWEAVKRRRLERPGARAVFLTGDPEPAAAEAVLNAGATAVVFKCRAAEELAAAIAAVLAGESYRSPSCTSSE